MPTELSRRTLIATGGLVGAMLAAGAPISPANAAETWGHPFTSRIDPSRSWGGSYPEYTPNPGPHRGIDYPHARGTAVHAVAAGVVEFAGTKSEQAWSWAGNHVLVRHASGYCSLYAHLSSISVSTGSGVAHQQEVGAVGNSGGDWGNHLHLEIWRSGSRSDHTDPYPLIHNAPLASGTQTPSTATLYETTVYGSTWQRASTGQNISSVFSAVKMGSVWADVLSCTDGRLTHTFATPSAGWTTMKSDLQLNASSISAVNVGAAMPQALAVENGVLWHVYADSNGWQKGDTGVRTNGRVTAARMDDNSIQAAVIDGNVFHHVWTSTGQWHYQSTQLAANMYAQAVNMGGGYIQVAAEVGGQLRQLFAGNGWQSSSSGKPITTGSRMTAVNAGGGWPQVFSSEGGDLYLTAVINGAWQRMSANVKVGGELSAVYMGSGYPRVYSVQ